MPFPTTFILALIFVGLCVHRLRKRSSSLRQLKGPPSPSFLTGNQHQLVSREQVGDLEFGWTEEFGTAYKLAGCLGEDILALTDPKALQHILQGSGYRYPKTELDIAQCKLFTGTGLIWAEGETHKRQRKVLSPAFSAQQIRTYLPIFQANTYKLSRKWSEEVGDSEKLMDVRKPLSDLALEIVGETGFKYRFGCLDDGERSQLAQSFDNLLIDASMKTPQWDVFFQSFFAYIPSFILQTLLYLPVPQYRRLLNFTRMCSDTADRLLETHVKEDSKNSIDMLSLLAVSNTSEDPSRRLEIQEVKSQLGTMMLAGQETTSNTLAWLFYELARHPKVQDDLRKEIFIARARIRSQGREDFTTQELDDMPLLNAIIKETLRFHAIVLSLERTATNDDVIPLAFPIHDKDGNTVHEIPIQKGQNIFVDITTYNRLPQLWGEDAHGWKPQRFLQPEMKENASSVGVYANLLSFSAGVRTCIGWRFALLQMQTVATELVEKLYFSPPPADMEILRVPTFTLQPMVRGKPEMGACMPLKIRVVDNM